MLLREGRRTGKFNINIIIYCLPQMKYLAAYALLALSGKKDISKNSFTQRQLTSSLFSATSDRRSQTMTSTDVSTPSRESPSTNSSPTDRRKSDQAPLPPHPPPRPTKNNKRRRKSPRRRKLPLPPRKNRLTKTSETSSVDALALFKSPSSLTSLAPPLS